MPGGNSWEVCLCSDFPNFEVWCRNFSSRRRARRFMKTILEENGDFYCATISDEEASVFEVYYWNGEAIISWDRPLALSRRQALSLEVKKNGEVELAWPPKNWQI
jgi:hypothetical protein